MTNEELKHLEQEKSHKERDARMKYGKRYKEVLKRQKEAKDKLHHDTRTKLSLIHISEPTRPY